MPFYGFLRHLDSSSFSTSVPSYAVAGVHIGSPSVTSYVPSTDYGLCQAVSTFFSGSFFFSDLFLYHDRAPGEGAGRDGAAGLVRPSGRPGSLFSQCVTWFDGTLVSGDAITIAPFRRATT